MTNSEIKSEILEYGFGRRSNALQVLKPLIVIMVPASAIIFLVLYELKVNDAIWIDALMVILTMGAAIITYQQWRDNRHEISIDKYYDFLAEANKWLECVDQVSKKQMHAYAELDKLEYVIVKYELGYIPPDFAKRAIDNFGCHCLHISEFRDCVQKALAESAYLRQTKKIATIICYKCDEALRKANDRV